MGRAYVLEHGDLYYQTDGSLVRILDNGDSTSEIVIRDPAYRTGKEFTGMTGVPNSEVAAEVKRRILAVGHSASVLP